MVCIISALQTTQLFNVVLYLCCFLCSIVLEFWDHVVTTSEAYISVVYFFVFIVYLLEKCSMSDYMTSLFLISPF